MFFFQKVHLGKVYRFLLRSYIVMMLVAISISIFGYAYSYWIIRQDINMNFNALLNEEKLTYDKEWNRVHSDLSAIASNSIVRNLAPLDKFEGGDLYRVVDLISEMKAILRDNDSVDSIGVYFYQTESFVSNNELYAKKINNLYLLQYNLSVNDFISQMEGLTGYFVFQNKNKNYIVFYHNIFNSSYKKVIASSFAILPWESLSEAAGTMFASKESGSYLMNSDGVLIGSTDSSISTTDFATILNKDHVLVDKEFNGKNYMISSASSDAVDIQYVIYAPKYVLFKNIHFFRYIIGLEIIAFLLVGGYLAVYFSKMNILPIERLLSLLKIRIGETENASFTQIYQSLENSMHLLIQDQESLYQKLSIFDLVAEKYVFTSLMRGWNTEDNWMEEYLNRIKSKYLLSRYRIVLFSFHDLEKSIFAKDIISDTESIDFSLLLFTVENVMNEIILKYDYNNPTTADVPRGVIVEMGDITACIVDLSQEQEDIGLQESVQNCVSFFKSVIKIGAYASVSGLHTDYEELEKAYEEALMTITHKSFWGDSLQDVVLYNNEKKEYNESYLENKLVIQAKKLSNCLVSRDYEKASAILDETIEKCFSKDINKLSYNQYQAATLMFIIFGNLSDTVSADNTLVSSLNWTSSDRFLSMSSLKDIRVYLHMTLREIEQKYGEQGSKEEEPEWLSKMEEYVAKHYFDSDINISAISNIFNISLNHVGRTFKKYRGMNMLDYIHQLRIKKSKELMDQGMSVTECADQVGYVDAKSFIRAFKRYEGITPGQYKSSN